MKSKKIKYCIDCYYFFNFFIKKSNCFCRFATNNIYEIQIQNLNTFFIKFWWYYLYNKYLLFNLILLKLNFDITLVEVITKMNFLKIIRNQFKLTLSSFNSFNFLKNRFFFIKVNS